MKKIIISLILILTILFSGCISQEQMYPCKKYEGTCEYNKCKSKDSASVNHANLHEQRYRNCLIEKYIELNELETGGK